MVLKKTTLLFIAFSIIVFALFGFFSFKSYPVIVQTEIIDSNAGCNYQYNFYRFSDSICTTKLGASLDQLTTNSETKLTFLFGYVTNFTHFDNLTKFNVQDLCFLKFRPINFGNYSFGEEIIVQQVLSFKFKENPSLILGLYRVYL